MDQICLKDEMWRLHTVTMARFAARARTPGIMELHLAKKIALEGHCKGHTQIQEQAKNEIGLIKIAFIVHTCLKSRVVDHFLTYFC